MTLSLNACSVRIRFSEVGGVPRSFSSQERIEILYLGKLISAYGLITSYEKQPKTANERDSWGSFEGDLGLWMGGRWLARQLHHSRPTKPWPWIPNREDFRNGIWNLWEREYRLVECSESRSENVQRMLRVHCLKIREGVCILEAIVAPVSLR